MSMGDYDRSVKRNYEKNGLILAIQAKFQKILHRKGGKWSRCKVMDEDIKKECIKYKQIRCC